MRKLYRNKRALSTVISTILMIMVVMIGMSLLFAYVAVYAQNYKDGIGGAVMESLTIEDVWFTDQTTVRIWVYNAGKVDSQINAIYDNGLVLTGAANLNTVVKVGEHKEFVATCPSGWQSVNNLKIVSVRGSNFEGTYGWPTEVW
jgi:hypothetical protein